MFWNWLRLRVTLRARAASRRRRPARLCPLGLTALEDRTLPSFAAPQVLDLGAAPKAVAVGHFEGTSAPADVVAANADGIVSVLLGDGHGGLQDPIHISLGGQLDAVAVGDFLGNGLQDIVAANADGTVSVLLSNGDGTFAAPETFPVGASAVGVAVGDFLGNGKLDVATANGNGTVSVLPGDGKGGFGSAVTSQVGGTLTSVAAGQFNSDGKTDLVVGASSSLSVLLSNGDGTFTVTTTVPFFFVYAGLHIPVAVRSVAVSDLRGDGKQDIVALASGSGGSLPGTASSTVDVLLGNGDGTFSTPTGVSTGAASVAAIVVGDFNGDGKPDIATSNIAPPNFTGGPTLGVLAGNGDGTFGAAHLQNFAESATALAAGDLGGDGKLDLAVAGDGVTALPGNGDGTFATTPSVPTGIVLPSAVAAGVFTGSGKPDLVTTGVGGNAAVLLNNGDGTFRPGVTLPVSGSPDAVVVGDFTGNGHQDIAVGTEGGELDVFLGNGDGTFGNPRVVNLGSNNSINTLVAGDFNGDGRLDLAAGSNLLSGQTQTGLVTVLLGNGDGTFRAQPAVTVATSVSAVAAADFNGDHRLDLVATSRFGVVTVLLGKGDGTFGSPAATTVSGDVTSVAVSNFFGDGKLSLAVTNLGHVGASSSISLLRGNGDGTFGGPITLPIGVALPTAVVAGDFFGDGKQDLVVSDSRADLVSVFRGNGDGTFQAPLSYFLDTSATQPGSLVAGDFNGDGKLDLAATNAVTNDVSVLLNTTPPPGNAAPVATATSLSADLTSAVFGQPVTLTATVTSTGGTLAGTVTFRDGTTVLGSVAVDPNGQASLVVSLGVSSHSLTASFAGVAPFTASSSTALTVTVHQAATTTTLVVSALAGGPFGLSFTFFTATVAPVAPGAGLPTGTVTFLDGGTVLGTGTLDANGQASLELMTALAPGTHSLTASYGGDGNFQASTSAATVETVNAPAATATALAASTTAAVYAQPVTLTATVTSPGGTPTGTVAFFVDGAVAGFGFVNAGSVATFTVALGVGSHSLTATFQGNSSFAPSSSAAVSETVSRASTTTALSASVSPVTTGKPVVLTAVVAPVAPGNGVPTGKVTFKDGNVVLGTARLDAGGKAALSVRFSTTGKHTITAVYPGDANFAGSSQTITEQVSAQRPHKATTKALTALAASANPARVGQKVTFTARVRGPVGTAAPTGTITFFIGDKAEATVALDATGKARWTRHFRVAGTFAIRAVFSGDSHLAGGSRSLLEQVD